MFEAAAIALALLLAGAVAACLRGSVGSRVVALQLASTVAVLLLVVLSRVLGEEAFVHVAFVAVVASLLGGLLYARMLEHWL